VRSKEADLLSFIPLEWLEQEGYGKYLPLFEPAKK
jgi:hypothetical protein